MKQYSKMTDKELSSELEILQSQYAEFKAKNLQLNMARGNPSTEQLNLSLGIFDVLKSDSDYIDKDGNDVRAYGNLNGVSDARELMASLVGANAQNCIICGSSSLNIMYDCIHRAYSFGICGSIPWCKLDNIKFICPVPGYDRHFSICEEFGIEMIPLPYIYNENKGDLNISKVEELVANDESIKGIWCVPQYSNPSGITYSEQTVDRLASLKPAASDFRIFWDNAYCVHHLYDEEQKRDHVKNILTACKDAGNEDLVYEFCSTSKVTNPGSGIAAFISSKNNIEDIQKHMQKQIIGYDKINHLRHARFLIDANHVNDHMKKHAKSIRPKFECITDTLNTNLKEIADIAHWSCPKGGYFINFDGPVNTATRIVELANNCGMVLTGAGSTWPYKQDPNNSNLRLCPTFPPVDELKIASQLFCICVKIASIESLQKLHNQ